MASDDIREMTPADFERGIRRSLRDSIKRGEESEDLSGNWTIEGNDAPKGQPYKWAACWETWFWDDDDEVNRVQKEHMKKGTRLPMTPRPFAECLERLKFLRPKEEWGAYRFVHAEKGMIIYAEVLR